MEEEIWKEIPGLLRYFASTHGRIKGSRGYVLACPHHPFGYRIFTAVIDGKNINMRVHRCVAMAFLPNPENKPHVAHNDGTRDNNHVSNLRWVTHSENMEDAIKHGTRPYKKTGEEYRAMRRKRANEYNAKNRDRINMLQNARNAKKRELKKLSLLQENQ